MYCFFFILELIKFGHAIFLTIRTWFRYSETRNYHVGPVFRSTFFIVQGVPFLGFSERHHFNEYLRSMFHGMPRF